jgi:hypothetical protein
MQAVNGLVLQGGNGVGNPNLFNPHLTRQRETVNSQFDCAVSQLGNPSGSGWRSIFRNSIGSHDRFRDSQVNFSSFCLFFQGLTKIIIETEG